jgi:hypothetical protein
MLNENPDEHDINREASIIYMIFQPPVYDAGGGVAGTSMPYASLILSRRRSAYPGP